VARKRFAKAVGARSARKLIRDIGGEPAVDLQTEEQRVVGRVLGELTRLTDGRIVRVFYNSGHVFPSETEFRQLLDQIEESMARANEHPLGNRFPEGHGFVDAVPVLVGELPGALNVPRDWLDGSVDSFQRIDWAVRKIGGPECLDRHDILVPLVAYVGEVTRNSVGGNWKIVMTRNGWEPAIVTADGRKRSPFVIFKELLESGSLWARVDHEVRPSSASPPQGRTGVFASQPPRVTAAVGALATVPDTAYEVRKRYGSGHPWTLIFHEDTEVDGFPFKAQAEAWFKRSGEVVGGTISRNAEFASTLFPAGTVIGFYSGYRDGRLGFAKPGTDAVLQGVPCRAGTYVDFRIHKGRSYVAAATLASEWLIQGERCPAGAWVELDRNGRVKCWQPQF